MGDLDARLQFARQRLRKYDNLLKGICGAAGGDSEPWPSGLREGTTGLTDVIHDAPVTVQQHKGGGERNSNSTLPPITICGEEEKQNAERANDENEVALLDEELKQVQARRENVSLRRRYIGRKRAEVMRCQREVSNYSLVISSAIGSLVERAESLETRKLLESERLEELMSTNVQNDVFHIWFSSGDIVTINGFRVGRPSSFVVPWMEVNAGLGQAALALRTVADLLGMVFTRFTPIPIGSFSKMISQFEDRKTGKRTIHNLFSDSSFSIFPHRSLNNALKAFLFCLSDAEQCVLELDPILKLPHRINEERGDVGGISVSLSQGGGEGDEWCRAMKLTLTNLKWILAASAKYGHNRQQHSHLPDK